MATEILATLTSKGQITVPAGVREQWQLKPGDQIVFTLINDAEGRIEPRRRRSIFERLEELKLPCMGRPLTQADVDASVAVGMRKKYGKEKG